MSEDYPTPANLPISHLHKLFRLAADASFGVYLIHESAIVRAWYLNDRFKFLASQPFWLFFIEIWMTDAFIYLACAGLEFIRHFLFRKIWKCHAILGRLFCR